MTDHAKLESGRLVLMPAALRGHAPEVLRALGWKPLRHAEHPFDPETQMLPEAASYSDQGDHILADSPPVDMPAERRAARADSIRDGTLAPLRRQARDAVDAERARRLADGVTHDFGAAVATLPDGSTTAAGPRLLQTRPDDMTTWAAINAAALAMVVAGRGDEPHPFGLRTADNAVVAVTWRQALDATLAIEGVQAARWRHAWTLKDRIATAATAVDLPAAEAGWP